MTLSAGPCHLSAAMIPRGSPITTSTTSPAAASALVAGKRLSTIDRTDSPVEKDWPRLPCSNRSR